MSTSIVYYPHAIYCDGLLSITQMMDVDAGHNFQDLSEFAASDPAPRFTGAHVASPDFKFSTTDVKAVLDACSAGSLDLCRDLSSQDVYVQYKAGQNLGIRKPDDNGGAGGNHLFGLMQDNGFLAWEGIDARMKEVAKIRCRLGAIYNLSSGNDPLVFSDDNDITLAPTLQSIYTLGPISLNGTALTGVEEAPWENNIEYEEVYSDGDEFLSYLGIKRFRPVITIRTRNAGYMDTFGSTGTQLSSLVYYLRKKLVSDINNPLAGTVHIKLTAAAGTIKARRISGPNSVCEITVEPHIADAATKPFTITSTAVAIT